MTYMASVLSAILTTELPHPNIELRCENEVFQFVITTTLRLTGVFSIHHAATAMRSVPGFSGCG